MNPVFCAVADDDTGATDLAGMLSGEGVRTVMVLDGNPEAWADGYDAVVTGINSRAVSPRESYTRTRQAVRRLATLSARVLQIKYCSTFDSTPEGNIGPSLDAAMDETGAEFTVVLPALPVLGRTTYMGHHFVNGRLLSESPMRNHPLTPMRNSNLVSHLQAQTRRRVGLAAWPVTSDKLKTLQTNGSQLAVLDCISQDDLQAVCEAIADMPLISGSSAPATVLPSIWQRKGWWPGPRNSPAARGGNGSGYLIVAGSCSVATGAQNDWLERQGVDSVLLDPLELLSGSTPRPLLDGRTLLLRTASSQEDIARVHQWAAARGLTASEAGLGIAGSLARLVREIVESSPPAGLVIAGGETSGAISRALRFGALEVGRNIEPGVPLCRSLGGFRMPVVLKSGNFGSTDFYGRALARMKEIAA